MARELSKAIKEIESDSKVQAVVLKSSNQKIFSAGLDIQEMNAPDPVRLADFWRAIQNVYVDLYGSRLATIAAIEGHAPAGGCLLSVCCDYRIMAAGNARIGLNETNLGIAAPYWLKDMFVETIGRRNAELGLAKGTLYLPQEALAVNLVDEVVPLEEVAGRAVEEAERWARIPPKGRVATKEMMRHPAIDQLLADKEKDVTWFCDFLLEEGTQKGIKIYLDSLSKKK
jgi:3,2-trans-enoyl-CoA isomerase